MHDRLLVALAALTALTACLSLPIPRAVPSTDLAGAPRVSMSSPRDKRQSPFVGVNFMVDPDSNANLQAQRWKDTRPADAALLKKIADHPTAAWFGDWTPMIENAVARYVEAHARIDALPVFVLYNVPNRDCGQYSKGGAAGGDSYKRWIDGVRKGIGTRRAVAVLEPDALGLLKKCLSDADQKERLELLRFAVHAFEAQMNTAVYIDAGNAGWIEAPEMAARLKAAGVEDADGFALNVSNYKTTEATIKYGKEISKRLGGKHFVIDTSRNGKGPPDVKGDVEAAWCNPPGRGLGTPPTTSTADPAVDAYLWLKKPGESDGQCNGGPKAGMWWQQQALDLAKNASF